MSVTSTEGADDYDSEDLENNENWTIVDDTPGSSGNFEIQGAGNHYSDVSQQTHLPLPSPFQNLNAPSDGKHNFVVAYWGATPGDFILHTEVKCWRTDNGVETLATTTYHSFDLDQGDNYFNGGPVFGAYADFCRNFSCIVLYFSEDLCERN